MDQDEPPPKDMAALREAVLGYYEDSVRLQLVPRSEQMPQRVPRRRLQWLKLPLLLVGLLVALVRMVVTGRAREAFVRQQRAVGLYRQLSGKDPRVAEAEVVRVKDQLMAIDERVRPPSARSGAAGASDRAELEAAAGALLAYHLGGRQTDDVLLGQIQAAWVEYEALQQQVQERLLQAGRNKQAVRAAFTRQEREGLSRQMQATMDRYLAGWRSWLDWHAEQDGSPDRDHRPRAARRVEPMTSGRSPTSGWESYEAWKRWYLREWGRVDEPRQYRPSVPLLGLYRVLSAPEGIQTEVEVAAVEPAAAAAAEREVRRRARVFFVRLQERIAQHGDRRGGVVLQVYFEADPRRPWPVWSVGDLAAPPSAPRRSEGELVAAALEDLGG